jgi:peptide/nickel transport system substrate-binding protein
MTQSPTPFRDLTERLRAGELSRRGFIQAATALGVGAGVAALVAGSVAAQDATPAPTGETDPAGRPATGTEGQERGQGGELRLISWQAATVLAAHSSTGSKDTYAGALIMEPVLTFDADGQVVPLLVEQAPTIDNGLLSDDLKTATFTFLKDLTWSDGEPVTANDLVFTWQWVTNEANASVNQATWATIDKIEATDDRTAVVTFKEGRVNWYEPFVGNAIGILYPAHVFDNDPNNTNDAFLTAPVGTGPYRIDSFTPNDVANYVINENYREPNKPYFATVTFKGGGDAVSSARAVVQTAEYDYAWNIQAEPELIKEINDSGDNGELVGLKTTTTEVIYLNFSDPNAEVDGQKSEKNTPHPFLTDQAVREALNLSVDRTLIAGQFYGDPESATANVLSGSDVFESPNTSWEFDLDKANQILDDAGWAKDGDTRKKGDVELKVKYGTSVNSVRQKTQQVVKAAWEKLGFAVELEQVDSGIFFDSSAGNDQNNSHFYRDVAMWSSGPGSPISPAFMEKWYAGPDGENIAQKANGWTGNNTQRYVNPDFDALFEKLLAATTYEEGIDLLIQMNDVVIADRAVIPLVARTFYYAIANRLNRANMQLDNDWVGPFDNIANWNEAKA